MEIYQIWPNQEPETARPWIVYCKGGRIGVTERATARQMADSIYAGGRRCALFVQPLTGHGICEVY